MQGLRTLHLLLQQRRILTNGKNSRVSLRIALLGAYLALSALPDPWTLHILACETE